MSGIGFGVITKPDVYSPACRGCRRWSMPTIFLHRRSTILDVFIEKKHVFDDGIGDGIIKNTTCKNQ
jgi:hypothetical protein